MRLRPRPTPTELATTTNDTDIPLKAQTLLGTKSRPKPSLAPRIHTPEPLRQLLATHDSDLGAYIPDTSNDTTPTTSQLMPWPSASNRPANLATGHVRSPSNSSGAAPSRNDSGQSVRPHQFYSEQKTALDSAPHPGYYEAAAQPLYVSQQTSASAVRDMALRKGSPTVQEIANPPQFGASKPLKSAMKQPRLQKSPSRAKQPKKLDISSLFSQSRSSPVSTKSPYTPSPQTETNEFFPRDTVHAQVRRQNGRFETYKEMAPPSTDSVNAARTAPRVKIFDADVYDETKLHKRRPPKGIKNWFDGFDISSDDEERNVAAEVPAEAPTSWGEDARSPAVSHAAFPGKTHTNSRHSLLVPQESRRMSSRYQATGQNRSKRAHSSSSTLNGSVSSAALADGHRRHLDSRLAHSQLDTESVLALSSDSDVERRDLSPVRDSRLIEQASATILQRPAIPPRKVHSKSSMTYDEGLRKSSSTAQTSGSIPIRLTDSIEIPPLPLPRSVVHSPRESEYPPSSRTRDSTLASSPNPSHRPPRSNATKPPSRSSATAETTTSSVPTDAAHMMAVTDEEMMLLELMRQKRAAMANNSFAEGYRLALQQEEEHLARKRTSAHGTAMKSSRAREREWETEKEHEEGDDGVEPAVIDRRSSKGNAEREKKLSISSEEARERRMRYSMIRKGSVDKNFRLGRFLAMEAAAAAGASSEDDAAARTSSPPASLARLERFLVMKPSLLDAIQDSRPVSGTEIETETMTETEGEGTFDEGFTIDEDDVLDERGVVIIPAAPSPMERLRVLVRGEGGLEDGDEDDEMRGLDATLAGREGRWDDGGWGARRGSEGARTLLTRTTTTEGSVSQNLSAGEFPSPPHGHGDDDGGRELFAPSGSAGEKRLSFIAPAILEEEPVVPDIPARHLNRSPRPDTAVNTRTPTTATTRTTTSPYASPPSPADIQFSPHYQPPPPPRHFIPLSPTPHPLSSHPTRPSASPSLSTSRPSPLTPKFTPSPPTNTLSPDTFPTGPTDRDHGTKYRVLRPLAINGNSSADPSSGSPSPSASDIDAFDDYANSGGAPFRDAFYPSSPDANGAYPGTAAFRRNNPPSALGGRTKAVVTSHPSSTPAANLPDPPRKSGTRKAPPPRLETMTTTTAQMQMQTQTQQHSGGRASPYGAKGGEAGEAAVQRMTSMSSMTSAGEDVLAAWAELGGGGEYLLRRGGW